MNGAHMDDAPEFRTPTCGARTRRGTPCQSTALMRGDRCRVHGGASTGPRTLEGRAAALANLRRGSCSGMLRRPPEPHDDPNLSEPAPAAGLAGNGRIEAPASAQNAQIAGAREAADIKGNQSAPRTIRTDRAHARGQRLLKNVEVSAAPEPIEVARNGKVEPGPEPHENVNKCQGPTPARMRANDSLEPDAEPPAIDWFGGNLRD